MNKNEILNEICELLNCDYKEIPRILKKSIIREKFYRNNEKNLKN